MGAPASPAAISPSHTPPRVAALTTQDREPSRSRMQSAFSWHVLGVPSGQERWARGRQPAAWSPTKPGWHWPHWKEPCVREVSPGRCHCAHHPTPCPVSPSFSPPGPYPGVDAHGVGDAVVLPGLTLINIRANLGGRERRGYRPHADTSDLVRCLLCYLSPPSASAIPDADPFPPTPSRPQSPPPLAGARQGKGREAGEWVY